MGRVPNTLASIAITKELIFCNAIANAQYERTLKIQRLMVQSSLEQYLLIFHVEIVFKYGILMDLNKTYSDLKHWKC